MNDMNQAKKIYEQIPIPEELHQRVQQAIAQSAPDPAKQHRVIRMQKRRRLSRMLGAAAAIALTFTVLLNTSTTFAKSMEQIPVIGAVARLLTFQSYEKETEDMHISVEIPSIERIAEETNGLTASINEEIHSLCQQYADEATQRALEYRAAFLATGGTEEEWAAHQIAINVGYEIKSQTEDYLSFIVTGTENWVSAYAETRYYNMDIQQEKLITLKDLLGEDYIQIANDSIREQMEQRTQSNGIEFFSEDMGGFTTITDDTNFYINEAGNPVIVFEKYEIAPGAAGQIEFEITR